MREPSADAIFDRDQLHHWPRRGLMYLRRLTVEHLKRVDHLELDFTSGGKPRMWTVLIGPNGTAKTSILQAIALAAVGSKQVNTLATPVVKHLQDRRSDAPLRVEALFGFTEESTKPEYHPLLEGPDVTAELCLRSSVELQAGRTSLDATSTYWSLVRNQAVRTDRDPLDETRATNAPLWFVVGYGIARKLPDPSTTPPLDRPSVERLEPLFSPIAPLASTSFSNHFLAKDVAEGRKRGDTSRKYGSLLNTIIKRGGQGLLPDIERLELRGQGGAKDASVLIQSDRFLQKMGPKAERIAGVALSHGYQSVLAWIADLVGHVLLEAEMDHLPTTQMEGLVLIDEIDLYLHPRWQATIIPALKRVFPRMQFVVSTHSPVVLSTLAPEEIVRLGVDAESGDVIRLVPHPDTGDPVDATKVPDAPQPDPRPMTGGELYRQWFDLDRLTPNPHGEELRRYRLLAGDPYRSVAEDAEMRDLARRLGAAGIAPTPAPARRRS